MYNGMTDTIHTIFGRPYTVYPTEHLQPHSALPHTIQQQNNNTPKHITNCFTKQCTNTVSHSVMRLALKYASSMWSHLASLNNINKLQVMQNAVFRTATRCTQTYSICHTKHTHFPYTSSTLHNTNRNHNSYHIPYLIYHIPSNKTLSSTTNIHTDPHTVTTTDTNTNSSIYPHLLCIDI